MSEAFDARAYVATLPRRPGVYRMLSAEGELLYVGKARNLKSRVASYFHARNVAPKVQALVSQVSGIEVSLTSSDSEALLLEYNLIKEHRPRFNVMLRDDKSFPYVHVTTEAKFPRLTFYRGPRVRSGRCSAPIRAPARRARPSCNCRSSSSCAIARTPSSRIAAGRACSIRSSAVRRHAWD